MTKALVSIIIPAYNAADTICASIDSALTQSYTDIEIIIVDDGSTDKTANICRHYLNKDARIKYISKKNSGVSAARNAGIKSAKGEFVSFLDADDLWERNKILLQVAASRKQPDAIILTELQRFSGDGPSRKLLSKTLLPQYTQKEEYIRAILNLENFEMACFGTALVRKAHLDAVGLFDETLITAEDWDLWLRLAFHFPFVNIDQPLRLYRKYTGSLTTQTKLEKTLHGQLYIMDKVARFGVLSQEELRSAKMRKYLEFAGIYRYKKMRIAANLLTAKAIVTCPIGCGEQFRKKLSNKLSNILKGIKNRG
jgi:glycosyltransferase involved in cell wall biosynthesis